MKRLPVKFLLFAIALAFAMLVGKAYYIFDRHSFSAASQEMIWILCYLVILGSFFYNYISKIMDFYINTKKAPPIKLFKIITVALFVVSCGVLVLYFEGKGLSETPVSLRLTVSTVITAVIAILLFVNVYIMINTFSKRINKLGNN